MLTSTRLTFAPDNPFPVYVTIDSPKGEDVTGFASDLSGYVATAPGAAKITSPDSTLPTFSIEPGTSTTKREFSALIPAATVNQLVALGHSSLTVIVKMPDGFHVNATFPCEPNRLLT